MFNLPEYFLSTEVFIFAVQCLSKQQENWFHQFIKSGLLHSDS